MAPQRSGLWAAWRQLWHAKQNSCFRNDLQACTFL